MQKKHTCPDCGGAPVNHFMTYTTVLLSRVVDPWTDFMSGLLPNNKLSWFGPWFIRLLTKLRLGKLTYKPSTSDSWRTRVLWQEAVARGIVLEEFHPFGVGSEVFIARYKSDERYFEVLPRPSTANTKALAYMDDKAKLKKHLAEAGLPVADGKVVFRTKTALELFEQLNKPVIVKPNEGSRSRHTTTHLSNKKDFLKAFHKAKQLSPWVMLEEELTGYVFRGTVVNKKFVAALRREPPYVIGDGKASIRTLVERANTNPLRKGPIFHTIALDQAAEQELTHWGKNWHTVPERDELVLLGQKTSRAVGGGITDVTEQIHPDNIALLEQVAKVLDDVLIGVDFIMQDASVPWQNQPRCGIIECNSAPFIDLHHYPLVGKPQNVAAAIWDMIYPTSGIKK